MARHAIIPVQGKMAGVCIDGWWSLTLRHSLLGYPNSLAVTIFSLSAKKWWPGVVRAALPTKCFSQEYNVMTCPRFLELSKPRPTPILEHYLEHYGGWPNFSQQLGSRTRFLLLVLVSSSLLYSLQFLFLLQKFFKLFSTDLVSLTC